MNDRQQDELLALSAIYPDLVSWRHVDTSGDNDGRGQIEVRIKVVIDWERERDVRVLDWVPRPVVVTPPAFEPISDQMLELPLRQLSLREASEGFDAPPQPLTTGNIATGGKSRQRRTRRGPTRVDSPADRALDTCSPSGRPRKQHAQPAPRSQPAPLPRPPKRSDQPIKKTDSELNTEHSHTLPFSLFLPKPGDQPESSVSDSAPDPPEPVSLKLRYLPPLEIIARADGNYPGDSPPESVELVDQVGWLGTELAQSLEASLQAVLTPDECLLSLADLANGPALIDTLSLSFPLDLRQEPSTRHCPTSRTESTRLSSTLASHNETMSRLAFSSTTFPCALCLSALKGSSCMSVSACKHVFCRACLESFFVLSITEGLVRNVACPSEECTKARAEYDKKTERERKLDKGVPGKVSRDELRAIVGDGLLERYEWLCEKQRVESDPSVSFCPRETCRAAVPRPGPEGKDENDLDDPAPAGHFDEGDKLRICPKCSFSFCVVCLKTWHGTRNPCSFPQTSSIVRRYLEGTDDERAALESRYGKNNVKRIVATFEEERSNREWREQHSTECPGCGVWVERSQGCAHMQCARCQTHFCFKCGRSLSPTDPYKHYNTPGSSCFNKLFDFRPGEEPNPDEWIARVLQDEDHVPQEVFHPQGWNPFL